MAKLVWSRDPDWIYIPGEDRRISAEDLEKRLREEERDGG